MPKKQKTLPSVEESLKAAAALAVDAKRDAAEIRRDTAEIRRDLAEIVRDRKREAAEREADRKRDAAAREAERKEREAERKREAAEREAERKREAAEREAERKREAAAWEAERKEREAERKREAAAWEAERKEREAERKKDKAALAEWQAKHDKAMEEIRNEVGGMANTEGNILEDEVRANLRESLQIGDIRLLKVVPNLQGDTAQYDALGINGKVSVLVEVKRTLRAKDVKTFVEERLVSFPDDFPDFVRDRSLIGAMVYQNLRNDDAAKDALKAGLILLRAEGKKGLRQIKTVAAARTPKTKPAAKS